MHVQRLVGLNSMLDQRFLRCRGSHNDTSFQCCRCEQLGQDVFRHFERSCEPGGKIGLRVKKKIVQSWVIKGAMRVVNSSGGAIGRIVSFLTKTKVVLASQIVLPASLIME